ncbi:MAG: 2,4-diaminopentanoate dehydrogenase [Thalassovita sp.]|nr:2,4-diaminopentanoate dehydrogenase [Thalassovita sp.]
MSTSIRVMILGTGRMGSGIAGLVLEKPGLELAGAIGRRKDRAGMDLGRAIGLDRDLGLALEGDLDAAIDRVQPDVAIQATCSRLVEARGEILALLGRGIPVISIAEEMAHPASAAPGIAAEIDDLARRRGVAVVGTGINPGFVLDLLIIAMSGVCSEIESINARRVNDLSPYGRTVLSAQGVGLTPEAFEASVAEGRVVGHIGFVQSIHMIAEAVGWQIERIEETRRPIIAQRHCETPVMSVSPGQVAGCLHSARAFRGGKPVIELVHPQQIRPDLHGVETGDEIIINGTPPVHLTGRPEIPGGQGTTALAVNMIPRVLSAPPGLHTMADLPVPAAMLGGFCSG